ncbi:protein FAM118A-like isoform X2 [Ambystoma mexicanum]|uniref:protein FAM118A-like isoform X2 n=1 Tax=Ambystoma mexicanum TaxID=8296 RepID=UPI0037E8BC57
MAGCAFVKQACPERDFADRGSSHSASMDRPLGVRHILKSLTTKHPKDIVLVIGTGVSASAARGIDALNCWRCCLVAILEAAGKLQVLHPATVCDLYEKVKREKDLLNVANEIIQEMSPRSGDTKPTFFRDCLMRIFENIEQCITCPTILEDIMSLMEQGCMIVTTNYDTMLESCGLQKRKPMESIDMRDPAKVINWAQGHKMWGILHIHGVYSDPCGIAWDPHGYKELSHNAELTAALQKLYNTKTFLFLGCGEMLREHVFKALFWYTIEKRRDMEHFMLVLKKDSDSFFNLQKRMLLLGIKLLAYGDHCAQFPAYIRKLTSLLRNEKAEEKAHPCKGTICGSCLSTGTCRPDCAKRRLQRMDSETMKRQCMAEEIPCRPECAKRKPSKMEYEPPKKIRQPEEGSGTTEIKTIGLLSMSDTAQKSEQSDKDCEDVCHL